MGGCPSLATHGLLRLAGEEVEIEDICKVLEVVTKTLPVDCDTSVD